MRNNKFIYCLLIMFYSLIGFSSMTAKAEENIVDVDLGYFYTSSQTIFKVMSNSASKITVVVDNVENGTKVLVEENGVWIGYVPGDLNGAEYSYTVEYEDGTVYENVLDPYGEYLNVSKTRNVIVRDSDATFLEWENQTNSLQIKDMNKIIYGLNVANFTSHSSWDGLEANRGKLLGLIQSQTKHNNYLTGFDYVTSLGVTYIEVSPLNDIDAPFVINNMFVTGDEAYSGTRELKEVVRGYYLNNIGVILTFDYKELSNSFTEMMDMIDSNGYLDDSGNLDLNKELTQYYLKNLIVHYANNYKLSGIKLENMSDYSVDFINELTQELMEINSNILVYGDGSYITENENAAGENNLDKLGNTGMLNGSLSYALFGDLLNKDNKGILEGNYSKETIESLKYTLLSGVDNGEVDYSFVKGVSYKGYWGNKSSYQLINYIGYKNGLSVYDRLIINNITGMNIIKQKMIVALGTMMVSGGIPYIYSGEEFLMSYLDSTNDEGSICTEQGAFCYYTEEEYKVIDWNYAERNEDSINAIKSLINYRKSSSSVAQTNINVIKNNVSIYLDDEYQGVIGFTRKYSNAYTGDIEKIFVAFNYSNNDYVLKDMESKGWIGMYTYNSSARNGETIVLKANSLYMELKEKQPKVNRWITLILVIGVIGGLYYANIVLNKKLVEKKGYSIEDIGRKYRPFIKKKKNSDPSQEEQAEEYEETSTEERSEDDEENKNGDA